jgi:opacity protein-like surface antigen
VRQLVGIIVLLGLLLPGVAWATDFETQTAAEAGYMWFFMYDDRASRIEVDPALCYGGTIYQFMGFTGYSWARNMIVGVDYVYSKARGEGFGWFNDESTVFDLTVHHASLTPGYVFEGRRLHPYLSGGLGATWVIFEPTFAENTQLKKDEIDFTLNLGAGADYTVWETGMAALERLDVGFRARYLYIYQRNIVDTAINGFAFSVRLNLRW